MDLGFKGFVRQGDPWSIPIALTNPSDGSVEAFDALPTARLYGQNGFVDNFTLVQLETGDVDDATNDAPIVITSPDHGLTTGQVVIVSGVGGNTAANGTFEIERQDADLFSLLGSTGNGAYTTGGSWLVPGLFSLELDEVNTADLTPGDTYTVVITWLSGGDPRSASFTFGVN